MGSDARLYILSIGSHLFLKMLENGQSHGECAMHLQQLTLHNMRRFGELSSRQREPLLIRIELIKILE